MTYKVKQDFLSPNRYVYNHPTLKGKDGKPKKVYKSSFTMVPKFITVHNTYNDAPAKNEAAYHNKPDNHNSTTFHTAIDDIEAVQVLPFNRNAYHCGDGLGAGNMSSIGVEICYSKSGGPRYKQAEENGAHYVATLLYKYGWGVEKIRQHYDWSRKNCPHRIRDEGRWSQFVARVQYHLNALKAPAPKEDLVFGGEIINEGEITLTENGKKACIAMIKQAVADGIFNSAHKEVEKYDDSKLLSYALIYIKAKLK